MKRAFIWIVPSSLICIALLSAFVLALPVGVSVAVLVMLTLAVLAVLFPDFAWLLYVASFSVSGLGLQLSGAVLQPEMLSLPLLLLAMRHRGSEASAGGGRHVRGQVLLWVGIALWLGSNVISSAVIAPEPAKSLRIVGLILCSLIAFGLVRQLGRETALRYLSSAVAFLTLYGVIILIAWVSAQVTRTDNSLVVLNYGESVYRTQGLMIEPNLLASLLVLFMCVMFVFRAELNRALLSLAFPVMGLAAFLSFTRAAWVGMAILLIVWVLSGRRALLKTMVFVLSGAFLVGALGALVSSAGQLLGSTFSDRLTGLFDFGSGTGAYRASAWKLAMNDYLQLGHPLIGLGTNSFSQRHSAQDSSTGEAYLGNFWIVLLHDSGLIGTVGFLLIAIYLAVRVHRLAVVPLYATLAVTALATSPMWFAFPWVALALVLTIHTAPPSLESRSSGRQSDALIV